MTPPPATGLLTATNRSAAAPSLMMVACTLTYSPGRYTAGASIGPRNSKRASVSTMSPTRPSELPLGWKLTSLPRARPHPASSASSPDNVSSAATSTVVRRRVSRHRSAVAAWWTGMLAPLLGHRDAAIDPGPAVRHGNRAALVVDAARRLAQLDEHSLGKLLQQAGPDTAFEHLAVSPLQPETDPVSQDIDQRRQHEHSHPLPPPHPLERDVEGDREDVVGSGHKQHQVEDDRHRAQRGAHRIVPRPLQEVVQATVLGEPLLQERIGEQQEKHQHRYHQARPEWRRYRVLPQMQIPGWEHAQRTDHEPDVPVRLHSGGTAGRRVGPPQEDRIDLEQRAEQSEYAEDTQRVGQGLGAESGDRALTHDIGLAGARPRV